MNLSRRRVQRLGMEAIVPCSARGLDLQCWRRPVVVLLPACQRCDDSADIDDTFGGVRSAGDERVNERAGLGRCSGPDGGMDGVCDQRRCLRGQCCMSDSGATSMGSQRRRTDSRRSGAPLLDDPRRDARAERRLAGCLTGLNGCSADQR